MNKVYETPSLIFNRYQEYDVVLASTNTVGDSQQDIFGIGGIV